MRIAALVLCASLLSGGARAEEPVRGEAVEVNDCDFLPDYDSVLPWHWLEASGGLSGLLNYNKGEVHLRGSAALEVLFVPPQRQELRLGAYTTFGAGLWGDARHGGFSPEVGGIAKLSTMPTEPLDFYVLTSGGYMWGIRDGGHDALHLRGGLGVRVLRALAIEFSGSALYGSFEAGGVAVPWVPGTGLQALVNVCAFVDGCNYQPPRQRTHERTCELYDQANAECAALANRKPLCAALDEALDTEAHPPHGYSDAVTGYLSIVADILGADCGGTPAEPAAAAVCRLQRNHAELRQWVSDGRERERYAALRDEKLAVLWRYQPFPVALRRALGCGHPAQCVDVCESRDDER
jgi:hypothetical protein